LKRTTLIQQLKKPDGLNTSVYDLGREYFGFQVQTVWALKDVFLLAHMGAWEFENGNVAETLYRLVGIASEEHPITHYQPFVTGSVSDVFYICQRSQEEYVKATIRQILDDEVTMALQRVCSLAENLQILKSGGNTKYVGWFELNNGFFFFIDKDMFEKTKDLFRLP